MGDTIRAQGDFPIFFGQEMVFVFLGFQDHRTNNFLLLKEGNDLSNLHACSFLAFPEPGIRRVDEAYPKQLIISFMIYQSNCGEKILTRSHSEIRFGVVRPLDRDGVQYFCRSGKNDAGGGMEEGRRGAFLGSMVRPASGRWGKL